MLNLRLPGWLEDVSGNEWRNFIFILIGKLIRNRLGDRNENFAKFFMKQFLWIG